VALLRDSAAASGISSSYFCRTSERGTRVSWDSVWAKVLKAAERRRTRAAAKWEVEHLQRALAEQTAALSTDLGGVDPELVFGV